LIYSGFRHFKLSGVVVGWRSQPTTTPNLL